MLRRTALLLALTPALALPAAAQAGEPFTVGEGSEPHIVVDPDGTGHLTWIDGVTDLVHYCKLPRGAKACASQATMPPPAGSEPDEPYLLRNGTKLHVVMPHYVRDETYLYTSTNGGSTWSGPTRIYDEAQGTEASEPILNHNGTEVVVATWNSSRWIFGARLDGAETFTTDRAELPGSPTGAIYDTAVARTGGTGLVAIAHDLDNTYAWTTSSDPSFGPWSGPALVGDGDDSRLASDGTNAYLLAAAGSSGERRMEVRRFSGGAFGPPVVAGKEQGYINDITVSGSGGVGAIWRANDNPTSRLRFALSTNGGSSFTTSTIAREDLVMFGMDIGLGADNAGFAVYQGGAGSTEGRQQIRVATTEPIPEPVVPPPPSGDGGTGTTTPPTTTVLPPTTTVLPPATTLLRRTASVKGATLTLAVPNACIPPGRPFVATLSWKKQRRKGNLFVKVRRVDFSIGTKRLKIDKKAPFRQTLRIPRPRAGQTYKLRARAYIKMRRGRSPKKSIVAALRVCG